MRALLTVLLVLALAAPASAEPPKAGKFYREGMAAMYDIGIRMPFEGNASMEMIRCRITSRQADCRLRIKQAGYPWCRVRVLLGHRTIRYPIRNWTCPREWRPDYYRMPSLEHLRLDKLG